MGDCFISYSTKDEGLAAFVHQELASHGLTVFRASVSLLPGQDWTEQIKAQLRSSSWVILLASREACQSAFVLQEAGMAMITEKTLVPIVWDMSPSELPGWINRRHALDLRNANPFDIQARISQIAANIQNDKTRGLLIAGAAIFGLIWLSRK